MITKTDKAGKADESSSTHQLSDPEDGQLNDYIHNEVPSGVHRIVSGKANHCRSLKRENGLELTDIDLQKETVAEVKGV